MFFFFFQAEDGIRDLYVTGVQTCALPISANAVLPSRNNLGGYLTALITAVLAVFGALIAVRRRREPSPETGGASGGASPDRGTSPEAKGGTPPEAKGGTPPEAKGGTPPETKGGGE